MDTQNGGGSPGHEQVPTRLINKIFPIIIPLMVIDLKFVSKGHCKFTSYAKTAKVQLIQNNNCVSIKNWGPISLTNNCLNSTARYW